MIHIRNLPETHVPDLQREVTSYLLYCHHKLLEYEDDDDIDGFNFMVLSEGDLPMLHTRRDSSDQYQSRRPHHHYPTHRLSHHRPLHPRRNFRSNFPLKNPCSSASPPTKSGSQISPLFSPRYQTCTGQSKVYL